MERLKVGVIGAGTMGALYAEVLSALDEVALSAVADIDMPSRTEMGKQYGCPTFASAEAMFSGTALDAVIIAVPDAVHRGVVAAAAEAGLAMLVEKPFATSVKDAEAMVKAVEAANVVCSVDFAERWVSQFVIAQEAVKNGQVGRVQYLSVELNNDITIPTQTISWASDSSPIWFLMSHTSDLVRWITGKRPVRVFARGLKQILASKGIKTYDTVEALVEYEDGSLGRLSSGWVLPHGYPSVYELRMRVLGTEAVIDVDLSDQGVRVFDHVRATHAATSMAKLHGQRVGGLHNMLREFVRCVREGAKPCMTAQDGLESTRLLAAVQQSVESGATVDVPR